MLMWQTYTGALHFTLSKAFPCLFAVLVLPTTTVQSRQDIDSKQKLSKDLLKQIFLFFLFKKENRSSETELFSVHFPGKLLRFLTVQWG